MTKLEITDSVFGGNAATVVSNYGGEGGAVYAGSLVLNVDVTRSTFTGNSAANHGGAIRTADGGTLTVSESTFTGNEATLHGAAIAANGGTLTVTDSTLTGNTASGVGGAIFAQNTAAMVKYSVVAQNSADTASGLYSNGGSLTVYQSLVADNTSTGIYLYNADADIRWSTVAGNTGNDLYANGADTVTVTGSIVLGAAAANSNVTYASTLYSYASGGIDTTTDTHNYALQSVDELFAGGDDIATKYTLHEHSVAINGTGITATDGNPTVDLAGNARPNDTVYDYGAYEGGNGPETPSMHVTTDQDIVDKWDGLISLREALTVYYGATDEGTPTYTNDGKTVTFEEDLGVIDVADDDAHRTYNLDLTHDGLVIEGEDRISFDGETFRLFYLEEAANVTINGVTFRNLSGTVDGMVLATSSDIATGRDERVVFNGCEFYENTTVRGTENSGYGACLSIYGMGAEITDSAFNLNSAVQGGAIYVNRGTLSIDTTTFVENSASENGGAIYTHNAAGVSITNSSFVANTSAAAEGVGGAVYLNNQDGTATITESMFTGNTAFKGGAIYCQDGPIYITGGGFTDNRASKDGGAIYSVEDEIGITGTAFVTNSAAEDGGAVYVSTGTFTVNDAVFTHNTAGKFGGAIYNYDDAMTVTGGTFSTNSAASGGAIYSELSSDTKSEVTLNGVNFLYNTAAKVYDASTDSYIGGAGGAYRGSGTIVRSTFASNTAAGGGAVYAAGDDLTVMGGTFSNNTATENGGAIYADVTSTLDLRNSAFTANTAANQGGAVRGLGSIEACTFAGNSAGTSGSSVGNGGAIYVYAVENEVRDMVVKNSSFTLNSAVNGGAVEANDASLRLENSVFSNNSASEGGGAVHISGEKQVSVQVDSSSFIDNTAGTFGGAVFNSNTNAANVLNFVGDSFDKNSATSGGAISATFISTSGSESIAAGAALIGSSTFTANTATEYGGAVYGEATIYASTFTNNSAAEGGAYYRTGKDTATVNRVIDNSTFALNTADSKGGAVVGDDITATRTTFTGNTAGTSVTQGYGGAIAGISAASKLLLENCTLNVNSATYGGAVNGDDVHTIGSSFIGNSATYGGAINAEKDDSSFLIEGGIFSDNRATNGGAVLSAKLEVFGTRFRLNKADYGGAILTRVDANTVKIEDAKFYANEAKTDGGAICAQQLTVAASFFESNATDGYGGAIASLRPNANVSVTETIFAANSAASGGGAISTDKLSVLRSTFNENTAGTVGTQGGYGGAIRASRVGASFKITDSYFNKNSSTTYGGAIHAYGLEVEGSVFDGNSAVYGGAAFRGDSTAVFKIDNSTFTANSASSQGGALYADDLTVTWSTFEGNTAGGYGGAIYSAYAREEGDTTASDIVVKVEYTKILDNTANEGGGIFVHDVAQLKVYQSLIAQNTGTAYGGGIHTSGSHEVNISWSTLADNVSDGGADLHNTNAAGCTTTVYGSILLNADNSAGRLVYNYSLWQTAVNRTGTATDVDTNGTNCNQYDPIAMGQLFVGGDDYDLREGSYAIDKTLITTTTDGKPEIDLKRADRPFDDEHNTPYYDYGAYEATRSPEAASMVVNTYDDVVDKWDGVISLREALTVYYGTTDDGGDGHTITFADTFYNRYKQNEKQGTIYLNVDGTFNLDSAHDGLVIEGADRIVFDGVAGTGYNDYHTAITFGSRIFYLAEAANVTFNNLTFQNISNAEHGGVIAALVADSTEPKTLTVNGSTFYKNTSTGGAAAIRVTNMNLTVNNSTFDQNTGTRGAAIHAVNVHGGVTVTGSTFTNNTASEYGGAMALRTETSPITITDTAFTSNKATGSEGGALYIALAGETVNINGTTSFSKNEAAASGGAIYFSTLATGNASTVNITGTATSPVTFSQNKALGGDGGAIYGNVTSVTNASFAQNSATANGGAITGTVGTVTSSVFDKNSAVNGGAVYTNGMTAVDTDFTNNTASDRGGAVISGDASALLSFTGGTFENNTATNRGGAVWGYRIDADGTTFKTNHATTEEGGAIFARAAVDLTGVIASGNTAGKSGGFLYEMDNSAIVTIDGASSFSSNVAGLNAGAIYAGNVQIAGEADDPDQGTTGVKVVFSSNTAVGNGGALYLAEGGSNTISNARFVDNTAGASGSQANPSGGAIYLTGTNAQLLLSDSYFEGNKAGTQFTSDSSGTRGFGGAIRNNGGALSVTGCEFTENSASRGCSIQSEGGTVIVTDSEFHHNTGLRGGGIIMRVGNLYVYDSKFHDNDVRFGGGLLGDSAAVFKVDGCQFDNNNAAEFGGAIYHNLNAAEITDCTFTGNTSAQGGAVNFYNDSDVVIKDCTLTGNTATGRGGAIFVRYSSNAQIVNCVITGNEVTGNASTERSGYGGGVYVYGNTTITQSLIADNTAKTAGGVYAEGSYTLKVDWSTLYNNTGSSSASGTDLYCNLYRAPTVNASIVGSAYNSYSSNYSYRTAFVDSVLQTVSGGYTASNCQWFSDPTLVFVDPMNATVTDRDYHLVAGSPAIDLVSSPTNPPATDLDGNVRPAGTNYDAGVYEFGAVPPSPAELPYSDAADAAFASLDDDDLAVDFDAF